MRRLGLKILLSAATLIAIWACVPQPAAKKPLGAPRKAHVECTTGICWINSLFDKENYVATPGGYCTNACASDDECAGGEGLCLDFTDEGKWCLAKCTGAADCREGFACWGFRKNACYSAGNLNCDP